MRRGWLIALTVLVPLATCSPASAQELNGGVIRGENVWLRSDPADDADILGLHQRGEAIAITGPAENANGETKTLIIASLTTSRDWYVPVEIAETGEAGWIAELFIDPATVTVEDAAATEPTAEPDAGNGNGGNANRNQNRQNQNGGAAAEPAPAVTEPAGNDGANADRQAKRAQRSNQANDAAAADDTAASQDNPTAGASATDAGTLGTSVDEPAPLGTTLSFNGLDVTVSNAMFEDTLDFPDPKGGYKFLVADVELTNNGADRINYSSSSFSGEDRKTGAGYDSVFASVDTPIEAGDLDPGEFVSGSLVLEVQETAKRVIIKFDPVQGDPNDLYWIAPE